MGRPIKKGSTDQSTVIRILDSTTFLPETGVTFETAGIDLWYRREKETKTSITEVTLAAVDSAHSDGGFIHIGDGYCRLDLPDAALATGSGENEVVIGGTITGMVVVGNSHPLVDYDPYDASAMGMTSIADLLADVGDASASTLGSLYAILGNAAATLTSRTPAALTANGNMKASLMEIIATALTETSGYIAAGFKKFFNVTTPVMTVESINQGADNNTILSNATYGNAALRTRGDAAWVTATGFSTHSAADVVTAMETNGSKLDHLWEMTEDDGGTRRLTTNALEQAPSGSGLDAAGVRGALGMSNADLDTQLAALPTAAENADAVCDEALSGHTTGGTVGAAISAAGTAGDPWSGAIPGSYVAGQAGYILDQIRDLLSVLYGGIGTTAWTYTVTDEATLLPIPGVEVWITTDIDGINKIAYGITNASGIATLYPNVAEGTTVYVWCDKNGVRFVNPNTEIISYS